MLTLYHGTGSQSFELLREQFDRSDLEALLLSVRQLLLVRGHASALRLLEGIPFTVFEGTNDFNDDFSILFAQVPLPYYEKLRSQSAQATTRQDFATIAETFSEIGSYIRFIALGLVRIKPGEWDVFLCHAGEDKAAVAEPLHNALEGSGIRCWYDRGEILWGDSVVQKIEEGLRSSRFVIVILSSSFLKKPRPNKELNTALHAEIQSGKTRVLPLLVRSLEDREGIRRALPFAADKHYLEWSGSPDPVVEALQSLVSREGATVDRFGSIPAGESIPFQAEAQQPLFETELWPEEGRPQIRSRASSLVLRERPEADSPIAREIEVSLDEFLAFSSFRYRTITPGRVQAQRDGSFHGRSFGRVSYVSKEAYYHASSPQTDFPYLQNDEVEYLQYRAEGTGFIRLHGEVLDVDLPFWSDPAAFMIASEPQCERWIQLLHDGNTRLGWLLLDENAEEVGRSF